MSEDEVAFFEAPQMKMSENELLALGTLNWKNISIAVMNNAGDGQTLEYLARCAQRLREGHSTGYCLQGHGTELAHFLWVNPYDGFHLSEIDFEARIDRS